MRKARRIAIGQVLRNGACEELGARAVVLACGGFEANAEMRATYLGPNWNLAKVRGSRYYTGRGLKMALETGARSCGQIGGAHSTCWDLNAPEYGDLVVGLFYHNYPGGSGLTAGAVFGRIAGTAAGAHALGAQGKSPAARG